VKDTENMAEQRTADVRTVGWSLRQKEILGIVLDAIQSLGSSVHALSLDAFLSTNCEECSKDEEHGLFSL